MNVPTISYADAGPHRRRGPRVRRHPDLRPRSARAQLRPPVPGQFVMLSVLGTRRGRVLGVEPAPEPAGAQPELTVRWGRRADQRALFVLAPARPSAAQAPRARLPGLPAPAASVLFVARCGLAPLRPAIERRLVTRAADAVTHVVRRTTRARILARRPRKRYARRRASCSSTRSRSRIQGLARAATSRARSRALAERIPIASPPADHRACSPRWHELRAVGVPGEHASFADRASDGNAPRRLWPVLRDDRYVCREGPVFTLAELDDIDPTGRRARLASRPPVVKWRSHGGSKQTLVVATDFSDDAACASAGREIACSTARVALVHAFVADAAGTGVRAAAAAVLRADHAGPCSVSKPRPRRCARPASRCSAGSCQPSRARRDRRRAAPRGDL